MIYPGRDAYKVEKKKTGRQKTLKHEDKEQRRMQGEANNNNKHLWLYLLYKKLYFPRKHTPKLIWIFISL